MLQAGVTTAWTGGTVTELGLGEGEGAAIEVAEATAVGIAEGVGEGDAFTPVVTVLAFASSRDTPPETTVVIAAVAAFAEMKSPTRSARDLPVT